MGSFGYAGRYYLEHRTCGFAVGEKIMKILCGKFRGRNIYMPKEIRPTQNVTRKAVFDIIGHDVEGLRFLDLYAGSGAVGLEALSLDAKVTFVEHNPECVKTLETNLKLLKVSSGSQLLSSQSVCDIVHYDAMASIKEFSRQKRVFDVVFLDPPYDQGLVKKTLKTLMAYDIVADVSLVIVQHSHTESLPDVQERFSLIRHRKYGKSFLAVLEKNPS